MSAAKQKIALRASSVPRFMQCAGSQFLPHVQSSGDAARLGTAAHVAASGMVQGDIVNVEQIALLHDVPIDELQSLFWAGKTIWDANETFFPNAQTEVTFKGFTVNGKTATATVTGTADIVSAPGDGTLRIADWKSGWREGMHAGQLKTYALLAYKASQGHGDDDRFAAAPVEKVYAAIFWMRQREVEGQWYDKETLLEWEKMLAQQSDKGAAGELVVGEGCTYCPVADCPALRKQVAIFKDTEAAFEVTSENVLTLHFLRTAVERRCGDLKSAIDHYTESAGPFETGDGRELAMVETEKKTVFTENAWPILAARFGEEKIQSLAKLSKADVETLAKETAERGQKGAAVVELLDELEAAGALEKSVSRAPRIRKVLSE